MAPDPVDGRGWWWLRVALVALVLGGISSVIAFSILERGYRERTGLSLDLGTGYELGFRSLLIGGAVAAAVLGVAAILSVRAGSLSRAERR